LPLVSPAKEQDPAVDKAHEFGAKKGSRQKRKKNETANNRRDIYPHPGESLGRGSLSTKGGKEEIDRTRRAFGGPWVER